MGYSILSSQLGRGTPFYERQGVAERFALIIGNEGNGVSDRVQQSRDAPGSPAHAAAARRA